MRFQVEIKQRGILSKDFWPLTKTSDYLSLIMPFKWPGPRCMKLTINGKLNLNGNYHRILDADWL